MAVRLGGCCWTLLSVVTLQFLQPSYFQVDAKFHTNIYPDPLRLNSGPGPDVGKPLFLTPFITKHKIKEAVQASKFVINVGNTSVTSYSGFLTVNNEKYHSNLFFWFIPAAVNPDKSPLLLWLQGGPGASSLFGLFNEIGPFSIDETLNVTLRQTAWTHTHSVVFFDQPVGTGYSFTENDKGYVRDEKQMSKDLFDGLNQFFQLFSSYKSRDFYITGESYAGKYVPAIARRIHVENQHSNGTMSKINLKGIAIGDGFTDPISQINYGDYLYNIGLLDANSRSYFWSEEQKAKQFIGQGNYVEAFQVMDKLLNGWNTEPSYYEQVTGFKRYYNYLLSVEPPALNYYSAFIQQDAIRKLIHVGNLTFTDLNMRGKVEQFLLADIYKSCKPMVEELLDASEEYKILIYSGQLDIIVAYTLTDNFVRKLRWKNSDEFSKTPRKIWRVDQDIAGYATSVGSFTQVLVRNAGHMVPADQGKWALDMISRFTAGKPFA